MDIWTDCEPFQVNPPHLLFPVSVPPLPVIPHHSPSFPVTPAQFEISRHYPSFLVNFPSTSRHSPPFSVISRQYRLTQFDTAISISENWIITFFIYDFKLIKLNAWILMKKMPRKACNKTNERMNNQCALKSLKRDNTNTGVYL